MYVNIRHQLLIRFGYDGSRFHGLQPQKDFDTAGAALRRRLESAAGERARGLNFSARTDAGVHALANMATCWFSGNFDLEHARRELERPCDDGLRFVKSEWVPIHVHARGSARGKRYRYTIDDSSSGNDDDRPFSWAIVPNLSVEKLRQAARHLEGTHDFRSFCSDGGKTKNTVKTLARIRVGGPFPLPDGSNRNIIEFIGTGFLRKMIRILVGTLVEVGVGLRSPEDMPLILREENRRCAGSTAPAKGLTLVQVGTVWPEDGSGLIPELSHFY